MKNIVVLLIFKYPNDTWDKLKGTYTGVFSELVFEYSS